MTEETLLPSAVISEAYITFKKKKVQVKMKLIDLLKGMFLHTRSVSLSNTFHCWTLWSHSTGLSVIRQNSRFEFLVAWNNSSWRPNQKVPHFMHSAHGNDQYSASFSWIFSDLRNNQGNHIPGTLSKSKGSITGYLVASRSKQILSAWFLPSWSLHRLPSEISLV